MQQRICLSEEKGPNLALSKSTDQSSTGYGGTPDKAVDGNTGGHYLNDGCTATSSEDSPWWSVDLGMNTQVTDVTLYNRLDCCGR